MEIDGVRIVFGAFGQSRFHSSDQFLYLIIISFLLLNCAWFLSLGPVAFSDCGNLISNHEHSIPGKLLPRGVTEWGLELKLLAFGPVGVQV